MSYNRLGKWTSPISSHLSCPSSAYILFSSRSSLLWAGPVTGLLADLPVASLLTPLNPRAFSLYSTFLLPSQAAATSRPSSLIPSASPHLRQKLCLCRNSVSFAWRKGATPLVSATRNSSHPVLSCIRLGGTGCFALSPPWSVTCWPAGGGGEGSWLIPRTH